MKVERFGSWILTILLGILFVLGGLGIDSMFMGILGSVFGLCLLTYIYLRGKRIIFPKGFGLYLTFLTFFLLSIVWVDPKRVVFQNFLLFLTGGLFWLAFYNLRRRFKKDFLWLIVFLGTAFGLLFLVEQIVPGNAFKPYTLYLPSGATRNHNHLGDLWALVLICLVYLFLKEKKWWVLPPGAFGIYFLGASLSRSAYLSLFIGLAYLFYKFGWLKKFKKVFAVLLAISVGLFIYAGSLKSIFLSRPYFLQAIVGLGKYPFGVGVGNFAKISTDPEIVGEGAKHFSSLTHNLVLEITSGLGIFGLVFVAWLFYMAKDLILSKSKEEVNILFEAIFFALLTNFMFDYTYVIPTMFWLWFASLGLARRIEAGEGRATLSKR